MILIATALLAGSPAQPVAIELTLTGAEPGEGHALAALFRSEQSWLTDPHRHARIPIDAEGRAFVRFDSLTPGTYAVSVIYDHNSNGRLDTNLLGIPKERVATSNGARGRFGPPKFRDATFMVSADTSLTMPFESPFR